MNAFRQSRPAGVQSGVVLIVGLVVLLVLTLLGVTAMRGAVLEERMSGNTQDRQIAFQFAEAALREGEALLQLATVPAFNNTNGLYVFQPPTGNDYVPLWEKADTQWRSASITGDAVLGRARADYLIEEMVLTTTTAVGESLQADAEVPSRNVVIYRITARAWGGIGASNPTPMVTLQSTFRR